MVARAWRRILRWLLSPVVQEIINSEIRVWGNPSRLHIARSARMINTLFNVSSGHIHVGEFTFTGHNVAILAGRHDMNTFMSERMERVPTDGCDVVIGEGVWIGSNATILGPCRIGDHAVIAANALVRHDVAPYTVVAGTPAKVVRTLDRVAS